MKRSKPRLERGSSAGVPPPDDPDLPTPTEKAEQAPLTDPTPATRPARERRSRTRRGPAQTPKKPEDERSAA